MAKSIGIDLGTTFSLVSTIVDGEVSILKKNADGRVPSALFVPEVYNATEGAPYLVGQAALNQATIEQGTLLLSTKRVIGKGLEGAKRLLAAGNRKMELIEDELHPFSRSKSQLVFFPDA